ncbi:MAG: hypothetical protein RJB66_1618 [Pseudomonadota bacterium]|jgi:hypothetical protein
MKKLAFSLLFLFSALAARAGIITQVKDGKALIKLEGSDADIVIGDRLVVLDDISEGEMGVVEVEKATMTSAIASILKGRVKAGFYTKKSKAAFNVEPGRGIAGEEGDDLTEEAKEERRQLRARNRLQDSGLAIGFAYSSITTTATQSDASGKTEITLLGTSNGPFLAYERMLGGGYIFWGKVGYQSYPYQTLRFKTSSGSIDLPIQDKFKFMPFELQIRNYSSKRNTGNFVALGIGYYSFAGVNKESEAASEGIINAEEKGGLILSFGHNFSVNANHLMLKFDAVKLADPTKEGITPSSLLFSANIGYFFNL